MPQKIEVSKERENPPFKILSDKQVILYGEDYCPYTTKVKEIFKEKSVEIDFRSKVENQEEVLDF
jgi:hypothetical protein